AAVAERVSPEPAGVQSVFGKSSVAAARGADLVVAAWMATDSQREGHYHLYELIVIAKRRPVERWVVEARSREPRHPLPCLHDEALLGALCLFCWRLKGGPLPAKPVPGICVWSPLLRLYQECL